MGVKFGGPIRTKERSRREPTGTEDPDAIFAIMNTLGFDRLMAARTHARENKIKMVVTDTGFILGGKLTIQVEFDGTFCECGHSRE